MRLISCKIENFGKLADISISFSKGYNVISQKNGWGKSTLASFIKIMFYGFSNETKRSEFENERKRYTPWQKGIYGGELVFELDEKIYSIIRVFGKKKSEDEFTLIDKSTNKAVKDYSENIGEELFGVDAQSFERTLYIRQNDCSTQVTDSIIAKLSNVSSQKDDIGSFEKVEARLSALINSMNPNRVTGSIYRLNENICKLEVEINAEEKCEEQLESIKSEINKLELKKNDAKEQLEKNIGINSKKRNEKKKAKISFKGTAIIFLLLIIIAVSFLVNKKLGVTVGIINMIISFGIVIHFYIKRRNKQDEISIEYEHYIHLVDEIGSQIAKLNEIRNEYEEKQKHKIELQDILKQTRQEYSVQVKKYDLLCKTKQLLEMSKESFNADYIRPMTKIFCNYYSQFSVDRKECEIDADLNVNVREKGMLRDINFLSQGNRDVIGLSMRMAFIELMFKKEKPFFVLDDPFVNLDDDNYYAANEVLKKISNDYQVVLFTSRQRV